jgi:hypothetical protein
MKLFSLIIMFASSFVLFYCFQINSKEYSECRESGRMIGDTGTAVK